MRPLSRTVGRHSIDQGAGLSKDESPSERPGSRRPTQRTGECRECLLMAQSVSSARGISRSANRRIADCRPRASGCRPMVDQIRRGRERALLALSRRYRHHDIPPVRAGHLHRRSRETRAAPVPRVGVKRPRLMGRGGRCPGGTFGRAVPSGGRHPGLRGPGVGRGSPRHSGPVKCVAG